MRRLLASRASTAAAGVAATVAILAVMVGVAQGLTSGQAGPPSQVYMQTTNGDEDEVCLHTTPENQSAMHQELELEAGSSVVGVFSFELGRLEAHEQGELGIVLTDQGDSGYRVPSGVWRFPGNAMFGKASGTVTWSFPDVPVTSNYIVDVRAWIGPLDQNFGAQVRDAFMDSCSLTVFVSPPVQ